MASEKITKEDVADAAEGNDYVNKKFEEQFKDWQSRGELWPRDSEGFKIKHGDPLKDGFHVGFIIGLAFAGSVLKGDAIAMWRLKSYFDEGSN